MENAKYSRSLEITSSSIKFAVGYVSKGAPHLLYYKKTPINGVISGGRIINRDKLVDILKDFHSIDDETMDLHIEPNSISLVIPSLGFKVFQCDKASKVIGEGDKVSPIDVKNVMMLVSKQTVEQGNVIVDVVPYRYVANSQLYKEPPLGVKCDALTVRTKVYTLPLELLNSYKMAVEDAGFRCLRTGISCFCAPQIIKAETGYPESYVLLDLGNDLSTISFIGNDEPYLSRFIKNGGRNLTEKIASELHLPYEMANSLKEKYGYNSSAHKFEMPIYDELNDLGQKAKVYQKDLNSIIEEFFKEFSAFLKVALKEISASEGDKYASYPIILTGGSSKLKGIEKLLSPIFGNRKIILYSPKVIGARDAEATNVLGMIVAEGVRRKTDFINENQGVSSLRRE